MQWERWVTLKRLHPPDLVVLVEPLLIVRRVLREQIAVLHRRQYGGRHECAGMRNYLTRRQHDLGGCPTYFQRMMECCTLRKLTDFRLFRRHSDWNG
jgi:hypothetical protein